MHRVRWLEADAARVERNALAHQQHRRGDVEFVIGEQVDDLMRRIGGLRQLLGQRLGLFDLFEELRPGQLELLVDAYQRRDRVGLVAFRGESAHVVLQPTASVELAQLKLKTLPTGGATPIAGPGRAARQAAG